MSLVNYSDSSSSDFDHDLTDIDPTTSKQKRLPLPEAISNIKVKNADDYIECSSQHDGRVRSFEHERGNWATYVYIAVDLSFWEELQDIFISSLCDYELNFKKSDDFHVSLTRTVVLRHHWIDSFINSIKHTLEVHRKFLIGFRKVNVYCNEEGTRTFIGLSVDEAHNAKLKAIVDELDNVLSEFNLRKFYEPPSFHSSILWCVGNHREVLKQHLPRFQEILDDLYTKDYRDFEIKVTEIHCRVGNKLFKLNLNKI